ncbi:hypothetical protein PAXRUDRAFT_13625 [Paxillus rubicundulus Ve08.2h10]|uniref:Unplaced genomic scaffold scaffold_533, whole genome shotgun sequence n=1 Tax=Paxillus rubicundulus Ve08.2h10 TaxID=930991 RepID=A0A0D0D539_9AGAM|nr:hypothetical protein PAXRUDRAFT_13625 [Paxillus rubicundulus Ve08.2h10]
MIHTARFLLYCLLFLFSIVVMALCAVRIHYTTHLSRFDPLNYGVQFYDTVVVELLVTSILTLFWAPFIARTIHSRLEHRYINSFAAELIGLFIFFFLWVVGAGIATHTGNPPDVNIHWGNLSSCWGFSACRVLTAMLAFAWLSWLIVLALFVTSLLFAIANKAFRDPMHGRWDRRATQYGDTPMRNLP